MPPGIRRGRLADLRFSLVGAGRVGTSLALWLLADGAELVTVAGRPGGRPLDPRLPPLPVRPFAELNSAGEDLLLLTVADPALAEVAATLARRRQAAVVLHCSGPGDAALLAPLAAAGSAVGTLHPLRAFPAVLPAPAAGTFYGLDGDAAALALAGRLAAAWGGETVVVGGERRQLYHLAATLAAGGVTTVIAALSELLSRAGLPARLLEANLRLMDGALEASRAAAREAAAAGGELDPLAFDRAITGPAARGDEATLIRQRAALAALLPELLPLVAALQDEAWRRGQRLRGSAEPAPGAPQKGVGPDESDRETSAATAAKAISSAGEMPPVWDPERE